MNQAQTESTTGNGADWRAGLYHVLSAVLGLILLTAGLLKGVDMELFVRQMRDYGIISHNTLLVLSAWGVVTMECTLGIGLLIGYRPRQILFLTALLFLAFMGATLWALLTGSAEDCGCFGAWLGHSPAQAALLNSTLLLVTSLTWRWCEHRERPRSRIKAWVTALAFVAGLALPVVFGFSISRVSQPPPEAVGLELGPLEVQGLEERNLNLGAHLIIVMATDCDHCQESVSELNMLVDIPDFPLAVALCTNGESERIQFTEDFQPLFPLGQIDDEDFWRLLGDGDMPRILLVQDGRILRVWDESVPDENMIRDSLPLSGP